MEFRIEAMECGGCARGVTRAIQGVDPEAKVVADPAARRVEVSSTRPREAFLPALAAAGFPAD
jgi:copper chaperone